MAFDWGIKSALLGALLGTPPAWLIWQGLDQLEHYFLPQLPLLISTPLQSILNLAVAFVVVFVGLFVGFTLLTMKQSPIVGVTAYLFFPRGTVNEDKTLAYHEQHHYRRTIVNTKRKPPIAYYLPSGSYSWRLIERHPELWFSELDTAPKDPDFVENWAKRRDYRFEPKSPSRENLLAMELYNPDLVAPFDHRLEHVEARLFYPFYQGILPTSFPHKRCILNWSTMKAWTLNEHTLQELGGKVRPASTVWWPMPQYVQRWARKHGFEWSDKSPTMSELKRKRKPK